ncbi:hypothetical protein U0070_002902, partial [Myodes glareolus]
KFWYQNLFEYAMFACWYLSIVKSREVRSSLYFVITKVGKTDQISRNNTYAVCPRNWIGFGKKCFDFSEDMENWTSSQNYCRALGAQLARFDSQEELNFLKRYKGSSDHWIGLHRESSEQPWMWTDNTEYNNLYVFRMHFILLCSTIVIEVSTRGEGQHAYLSDRGISSGRNNIHRKWICSMPNIYTLQCPGVSQLV